ncbi:MAG: DctP family TRAP transporter solute-binding subunit [Rhodospirillales bacterium]|nr:DctP family TRAP transporter solute-binding subunit [Rhodospirillales bacterium]
MTSKSTRSVYGGLERAWLAGLVFLALANLYGHSARAEEPIRIRFSHVVAEGTPKGQAALAFKREAEKRLGTKVRVELYPNGTLFSDADEMAALLAGKVEILAPSLSKFEPYTKKLRVFDLPFLFDGVRAVDRFQNGPAGLALLGAMTDQGIRGLAFLHNGMKQMIATRPLRRPENLRGMAVRIQDSDVIEAQFRALGANPVRLDFARVREAVEKGAIEAQENTWSNIASQGFHKRQRHVTETNHAPLEYLMVTSTRFWDSLPALVRLNLEVVLTKITLDNADLAAELNDQDRRRIQKDGAEIIRLSPGELALWRQAMEPVWRRFEPDIGKDLIDAALAANTR